ncbi:hypothetical protein L1987_48460 [Smallanthus sonchifolius]|uniref:Uncharacterized protein n=1 Tax=Smallanthus sonchifolius TaxID=185202 RepID=A0ACB9FT44_9ASTR|nr:hypothetical protein L1987_48460 [Smallanthus sonchifolius]
MADEGCVHKLFVNGLGYVHSDIYKENVKGKARQDQLKKRYQVFARAEGESLTEQYHRYVELINDLNDVDIEYEKSKVMDKFLNAQPQEWEIYKHNIRNKRLEFNSLEDLCAKL